MTPTPLPTLEERLLDTSEYPSREFGWPLRQEAADELARLRAEVERLCSDVGRLKAKLLETNERIESAVISERERCAKIAESYIEPAFPGDDMSHQCKLIAHAIRASAIAEEGK